MLLAILIIVVALLCYSLAMIGLIVDLLVLLLSFGKSMAGVGKAFAHSGNDFIASIHTISNQFFNKDKNAE